MLLVEKVLALKATDIFREVPEQDLVDIAMIMEELEMDANTLIFSKGDIGDSLYIIHQGSVRIHDGEHQFAVLHSGEIFGELSLLDAEPRSADATTKEDCLLLFLKQEPFMEAMIQNSHVLKGILATLCRRLREEDRKAAAAARLQLSA